MLSANKKSILKVKAAFLCLAHALINAMARVRIIYRRLWFEVNCSRILGASGVNLTNF